MKNLNLLLILLILAACGADPDDYTPEKPDGCKSDDLECQEALDANSDELSEEEGSEEEGSEQAAQSDDDKEPAQEEGDTTVSVDVEVDIDINTEAQAEEAEEAAEEVECAANKICRGSTKADVLELLGDPDTLDKSGKTEGWEWQEFSMDDHLCGGYTCQITFVDGVVSDQERVHTRWLDLENF